MSLRNEQCNKVCRILDYVLANRPTKRDSLITAVRKAFGALETEPRWIPCSERLPEIEMAYVVTVLDESGDGAFTYSSVGFCLRDGCWLVDNEPMCANDSIRVIAWMPLPEPYEKDDEEK